MNLHFFTAPFYFAFIWFRVQGSGFRALVAASPPFLEDGIFVSQPSPWGILEDIRIVYFVPLVFMPPAPYPARCTRCLPHRGRLGIWERGRTIKKANRNGSPFLFARLACVSEVVGRYRAKARKRAGLERCDRVSCGIQFISRGRYFDLAETQILHLGSPRGRILYTDLKFHIDGFRRGSHSILLYGNHR